jgi:signal peptide peptidase SppA
MPVSNPLLARLDGHEVLVAHDRQPLFESCITQLVSHPKSSDLLADTMVQASNEDNYWPAQDDWRAVYRPYVVKLGILQIPIFGVLLHRFGYQFGRYATGYTYIERCIERGMADPEVRGVAFLCDTPGGEVAGNFELVDKIYAYRGKKPMRAFAAESAYSAGYSIASAADQIAMTNTAGVGSIGVLTAHVEYEEAMAKMGVKVTFIYAGEHKVDGNPYEKLKPETKARIQARVDRLYGIFCATVSRNRGMSDEAVRDTKALTFNAEEAIEKGLADSVGIFEESLEAFRVDCEAKDEQMATTQGNVTGQATGGDNTAAVDTARAEGHAAGVAEGMASAKTRITAILGCDNAKDRPAAALAAAMDTDMTAEQASVFLGKLAKETPVVAAKDENKDQGNKEPQANAGFQAAMDAEGGPGVGGGPSAKGNEQGDSAEKDTNTLLGDFAGATGIKRRSAGK